MNAWSWIFLAAAVYFAVSLVVGLMFSRLLRLAGHDGSELLAREASAPPAPLVRERPSLQTQPGR